MQFDALYDDPVMASFYDLENGWSSSDAVCLSLAAKSDSVLDFGCGTGTLACAIATRHGISVTGVDPAEAMLDLARSKSGSEHVHWVRGDSRTVRLDRRFDLIVMTGHAFQVFLSDDDRMNVLANAARHLADGGRLVFDSRNPARKEWLEWNREESMRQIMHPEHGETMAWNDVDVDERTGIVTYGTHYRPCASDLTYSAHSSIAFPGRDLIAAQIDRAGLQVERWLGDWSGTPYEPDSGEIIPMCRHQS
ncbi:class I SAM-dependent methyltransferase [Rhodococcus sp. ABRD24]|uniref:class I SAM-dependent methyltransferase n=1 Tax=Rhodococcus sp. ABRD24 TaxID=2507582 RepID=UPI00103A074B|nr:class I SAM-dependent methyltransferase [Rhodococcus sp. ABRD24]QBJ97700.1 class I SAM-dependent methyltransferase [Rhodococcus sp. ABRD24]